MFPSSSVKPKRTVKKKKKTVKKITREMLETQIAELQEMNDHLQGELSAEREKFEAYKYAKKRRERNNELLTWRRKKRGLDA